MDNYDDGPSAWFFFACVLGVVIMIGAVGFGVHACQVAEDASIGRVDQDVRTANFEQSEAYKAGLRRDFDELYLAYISAKTAEEKTTVLSVIRHRAEGCPPEQVPKYIKQLLNQK